jgi:hypothetical protein
MAQPLWKQFLIKVDMNLSHDPPMLLLGVFLKRNEEICGQLDLHSVVRKAL